MIGLFKDQASDAAKAFLAAAESQESLYFGISTSQEVADALEAKLDTIALFKKVYSTLIAEVSSVNNLSFPLYSSTTSGRLTRVTGMPKISKHLLLQSRHHY